MLLPLCSLSLSGSLVAYVYGRPEDQSINIGDFSSKNVANFVTNTTSKPSTWGAFIDSPWENVDSPQRQL